MDTDIATALATDVRSLLGLEDNTDGNTGRQAIISALKLLPKPDGAFIRKVLNAASAADTSSRVEVFFHAEERLYSVTARFVEVHTARVDVTITRLTDIVSVQPEQGAMGTARSRSARSRR